MERSIERARRERTDDHDDPAERTADFRPHVRAAHGPTEASPPQHRDDPYAQPREGAFDPTRMKARPKRRV